MDFELNRILNHSLDANISTGLDFVSPVHSLSMALVCYDTERQRLTYAAADRSLYLMNKGELLELPGTTDPLGLRNFMTRSTFSRPIDVFPGDRLYLFTDGITSQEHFQSAEPFAIKRLQRHLLRSQRSNLEDQKKYIYQALIDWKSPKDYTDDILLLGVQF
jgi:serine phosphatase RsbU (regulator of sigma subunit)